MSEGQNSKVAWLNHLSVEQARAELLAVCASERWANGMVAGRPFQDVDSIFEAAEACWNACSEPDYLEAFAAHPLIGDLELLRYRFAERANTEQGQVLEASEETLQSLASGNQHYLERHGFIFIVCASGKSADEMLTLLESRVNNETDTEISNAAIEQAAITQLRLRALLSEGD